MLGRVRVFARDRGWEEDKPTERQNQHWWAHSDSVSRIGWELVADRVCRPSWDRPLEVGVTATRWLPLKSNDTKIENQMT